MYPFPFLISSVDSKANVENVVNPPHTPTLRNNNHRGFKVLFFVATTAMMPITIQPIIFIINVFIGIV